VNAASGPDRRLAAPWQKRWHAPQITELLLAIRIVAAKGSARTADIALAQGCLEFGFHQAGRKLMNGIIYLVGLVVVVLAVLSFFGLR
jgi:isoprenylcysteine carboxyl methyltransferase (ICMT) family protein YpbQ